MKILPIKYCICGKFTLSLHQSSLKYGSFGTGIFPRSDWIVIYFFIINFQNFMRYEKADYYQFNHS